MKKSVLLIGKPSCGKGTQSKILCEKYGYQYFGMGEILRRHKKLKTKIGLIAIDIDSRGELMPDKIINKMMKEEIELLAKNDKPICFDGVVRTEEQLMVFTSLMVSVDMDFEVIHLEISDENSKRRSIKRGETSGRAEDTDSKLLQERLDNYYSFTRPVVEQLEGVNYHIDAMESVSDIEEEIFNILELEVKEKISLMIDIETMGKGYLGLIPILSIGAIPFNSKEMFLDYSFDEAIGFNCYDDMKADGLDVYPQMDTIKWWLTQPKEATERMLRGEHDLYDVMNRFQYNYLEYIVEQFGLDSIKDIEIYCKSPDFDIRILNQWATKLLGEDVEIFKYNKGRCVRTVISEFEKRTKTNFHEKFKCPFEIIPHYAFDDCKKQIAEVQHCWNN